MAQHLVSFYDRILPVCYHIFPFLGRKRGDVRRAGIGQAEHPRTCQKRHRKHQHQPVRIPQPPESDRAHHIRPNRSQQEATAGSRQDVTDVPRDITGLVTVPDRKAAERDVSPGGGHSKNAAHGMPAGELRLN